MSTIKEMYQQKCDVPSDIDLFLPILYQYGLECRHITEMGVRGVTSTWAFLLASPEKLVCIDWDKAPYTVCRESLNLAKDLAEKDGIQLEFVSGDSIETRIDLTDLLFIDTWHTYEQLLLELLIHSGKVRKYIIAHDTSEKSFPGMSCAVKDFLVENKQWMVTDYFTNEPGMIVLSRMNNDPVSDVGFDKVALKKEIEIQRALYYQECDSTGAIGDGWKEYRKSQFERFSNKE